MDSMTISNIYNNDMPYNHSSPSTMQSETGKVNSTYLASTIDSNEKISYQNYKLESGEEYKISDEDCDYLSPEDMEELDRDLAEIMNDLHIIPYDIKQERSQTAQSSDYGFEGSTNNSQQGQSQSFNNSQSNNINKKMRKKKRKKTKNKVEKEGISYDPPKHLRAQGNVQISKNLTENIIPSRIREPIDDVYRYMDKLTALHCMYNDINLDINDNSENIMILNYGFHDKESNKILYCIAEKQDVNNNKSRGYKWRVINRLFTDDEIQNEYQISSDLLPKTYNQSYHFQSLLNYQSNIQKLLSIDSVRSNMIQSCPWHKIEIYHRTNNKRRLTLSLTKPEFMRSMQQRTRSKLAAGNNNINLIPILVFDNDSCQYLVEFVWIIEIEPTVDIGISFKYIANKDSLKVTGIHLDADFIKNQHQLIDPHHDCHCLDSFTTKINMMAIGNPDDNINKIKYYKQQIDELNVYKQHLMELLNADNNHREHLIQAIIQKTGIGEKSTIRKQQIQRPNVQHFTNQQQASPQQSMNSPSNMSMNGKMNMNMNMNRYNLNHCQVQPRPRPHSHTQSIQQSQMQMMPVITDNRNINNYNNMNYVSSNNNNNSHNLYNPIYQTMMATNNLPMQMSMYPRQQ